MFNVEIVADSIGINNQCRLTSFILEYPRFIHSEFMTHRQLSRNAASSRAIPTKKMIEKALYQTAMPVYWGSNKKGMQAGKEIQKHKIALAKLIWKACAYGTSFACWLLNKLGVHKQTANRLIEPFLHMKVIATATDWINFFNLRVHPTAQPEFQELARLMLLKYRSSKPTPMHEGDWHVPFCNLPQQLISKKVIRQGVARCARTSYYDFFGKNDLDKDLKLHDNLLKNKHMSPFEHVAQCMVDDSRCGNFKGWKQYRKTIKGECFHELDADFLLKNLSC